eukprot:scaffold236120_cov53-Prasinocladus_malaysianus.AAC.3
MEVFRGNVERGYGHQCGLKQGGSGNICTSTACIGDFGSLCLRDGGEGCVPLIPSWHPHLSGRHGTSRGGSPPTSCRSGLGRGCCPAPWQPGATGAAGPRWPRGACR